ncbi:amine acid ABC transporter, permease protein, 3-TM region, His/Glu/Gln/Arg/opine family [Acidovorax sp. CF316]|uniref:amino acid ABC transporter permease n=1 Tax=Acidovorax sp. CF316 TaxID=1144317 RepID=UPI00026BDBB8|nr:amino acid ABC transporter permease [Acidovorax sp. CF316]EJE51146.1 amine acid ABC transporter, permease protein, 3-TM region, His/Glu/Gln/Arg/opine family [Acidovorax sp. CF316]
MPGIDTLTLIVATLARGALTAAQVALGAGLLAASLGLLLALAVVFVRNRLLQLGIAAYVEWMRNVPALAHLFVLYFGLASVGVRLSPLTAAVVGLGLVGAAVLCDVFAAGLRCLHAGQREAALAVGLTPAQALRSVLLPQMVRVTLPSLGNYASQLVKDTSIASAIAAPEVMFYARNLVTSTFETPLIYLTAMLLYAAMVLPISWAFARLERRTAGGAR